MGFIPGGKCSARRKEVPGQERVGVDRSATFSWSFVSLKFLYSELQSSGGTIRVKARE